MATLRVYELTADGSAGSSVSLRQWLDGRWAILFSHPDDSVRCEFELDRWLDIVGNAFRQARIRPLALAQRTCPVDQGWVSQVTGDDRLVSLYERTSGRALLDFHSCRLRACIDRMDQRFAMIIDPMLGQRHTLVYEAGQESPSPLDLIDRACRLRGERRSESQSAAEREQTIFSPAMTSRRSTGAYAFA